MAQTAKKTEPKLVETERDRDPVPEISIPQELEGERVADTLIRARQQYGQDLRSIAQVLCIRYSYLDAIERSNFEDLPGPTYAVGFVRTYAEFLGLEGDSIVERFKNEVEGLDGQTKLHFPTPAPEGKMPGGAVFLVAALLFAGAYGVWFYLSNKGETIGDLVAPVPDRLQELVAEDPAVPAPPPGDLSAGQSAGEASAPAAASETAETAPETAKAETPAAQDGPAAEPAAAAETPTTDQPAEPPSVASETSTGDATPVSPAPVASETETAPASGLAEPSSQVAVGQPAPQATDSEATAVISTPSVVTAEPAQTQSVVTLQQPGSPQPSGQQPAVEQSAALAPATGQNGLAIPAAPANNQPSSFLVNQEPRVYGDENTDARVVLRANQDAWVQVRDREGTLLLTRVLRVGDSYRVPNTADLTLLTGNAGGLEILVDGTPLTPLGPVGAVRRNIPLDPEQLLNGAGRRP
ncbi:helix-turn-helix domain-containing protein [Pelagibius sp.]|uniref:helix-turn-helix domain-containing protein n=1 Tax=Pelagibius sp. TaxID=1931238 RepID=UPI00260CF0B5|nr:RodZ domain-containing protein [Pelagibius sp.]